MSKQLDSHGTPRQAAFAALTQTRFASLHECLDAVLQSAIATLQVSRASVWRFEGDGGQIHCTRLALNGRSDELGGTRIRRAQCPAYFDALHSDLLIAAGDARQDPRTCELTQYYLEPLGVRALLDVPIRIFGRQVGVLCLESETLRDWQRPDEAFAVGLGTLVSLAYEHAELLRTRTQMQISAEFDQRTGLANLHRLERTLLRVFGLPQHSGGWLVHLQLRQYPYLRSHLSEPSLNELYQLVADRLRDQVPGLVELAHAGDAEYCLLTLPCSQDVLVDAIRASFLQPILLDGESLLLTPQCGLRVIAPAVRPEVANWMREADTALHEARQGAAEFVCHSPALSAVRQQAHVLEQSLRRAVRLDEFVLHLQPMFSMQTGRVAALEALIRWRQPDGVLQLPDSFLDVLLQTGLIIPVGRRLLRHALEAVANLQKQWARADLGLSFNLSAPELVQPGLCELLTAEFARLGFPPAQLAIELTETVVISDQEGIVSVLRSLRALGCRVHLDDFGTGYSSLNHMRLLPFDALKIDRSFLCGALVSEADRRLIRMLVDLCRELGRESVAEGIADVDHLRLATDLAADLGQGYLLSYPVAIESISSAWLADVEQSARSLLQQARSPDISATARVAR